MNPIAHRYGRLLGDFVPGETYLHPWEVTVDGGMVALFQASFLDAMPLPSSRVQAQAYGFAERPLHPLLLLNLGLSFSVHDVSEQAIAHLAYLDVRYPEAGYPGATVHARSTVIDVKPSSTGDKGVVHVRTALTDERGRALCLFERKALIRAGALAARPKTPPVHVAAVESYSEADPLPPELRRSLPPPLSASPLPGALDDFKPGQVYTHQVGKTIGESEHMQLTFAVRNSHPLHFDELYCKDHSFAKQRVVYGGLVFGWVASLASRDIGGHALWELGFDQGAHPAGVLGGDTLYAASKVLSVADKQTGAGEVTMRLVGVRNKTAEAAYSEHGDALFEAELGKKERKVPEKVFEITRTLYVRKR